MPLILPLPLLTVFAVMAALLIFSGLLLAGGVIVRRLKLPTDLPEGPRFSPPAPPAVDHATPGEAQAVAARTHRRAALGAIARECVAGAYGLINQPGIPAPQVTAALAVAQEVEKSWTLEDLDAAEKAVAEAAGRCRPLLSTAAPGATPTTGSTL